MVQSESSLVQSYFPIIKYVRLEFNATLTGYVLLQIAEQLSQVLGRKITHRTVSVDERRSDLIKEGLPEQIASLLAVADANFIASGTEEKMCSGSLDKAVGKIRFFDFAQANKAVWQK